MRAALSLIVFVVLLAGVYVLSCWWLPFAPCWCCKGVGRHYRKDGKALRMCWWCKGTGRRRRIGRRLYDRYAAGR